jgi:hypothetical protein
LLKFEAATVNANKTSSLVLSWSCQPQIINSYNAVLVTPADNAINQALEINLAWTATDIEKV